MYYDFTEAVSKVAGHRVLALNRGEKEKFLSVKIEAPEEEILRYLEKKVIRRDNPYTTPVLKEVVADSYQRLIAPAIERELRNELTEKAEDGAILVFGKNLEQLLMQPPIVGKVVLGWDPAFRTGCKLAVVDETGKVLDTTVIYPTAPTNDAKIRAAKETPDMRVLMKKFKKSFDTAEPKPMTVELEVGNTDRAFGTIFGSEITRKFGNTLPEDTFHVICNGYGGQSFGAFIPAGLTLELVGDSNDYMGKGLSGGKLIVYPPKDVTYDRSENIVIGNVALYGATAGKAFINGVAGERFCVRNSGATAVVEGVGDHGCEYMTGGTVVVLGKTGKNFAAGMSGGIAYVLDEDWDFYTRVNKDMVSLEPVEHKYDVSLLKDLIREHVEATGSPRGKEILDNFGEYLPKFKKVLPHDYDKMLRLIAQMEEKGEDSEQAQIEAFYAMKNAANK